MEKLVTTRLLRKLTRNEALTKNGTKCNGLSNFYGPPVFHVYELKKKQSPAHPPNSKFLLRGDCQGRLTIWNLGMTVSAAERTRLAMSSPLHGQRGNGEGAVRRVIARAK